MSDTVPDKVKQAFENAKKAADRREDQIEQTAAKKVEPHLHEARERLAEASREK
jgi:hypothetical protein